MLDSLNFAMQIRKIQLNWNLPEMAKANMDAMYATLSQKFDVDWKFNEVVNWMIWNKTKSRYPSPSDYLEINIMLDGLEAKRLLEAKLALPPTPMPLSVIAKAQQKSFCDFCNAKDPGTYEINPLGRAELTRLGRERASAKKNYKGY